MGKGRVLVVSLVASFALMSLPVLPARASAGAATGGLPNLVIDAARVQASIVFKTEMFTSKDCAYVENSLTGTGKADPCPVRCVIGKPGHESLGAGRSGW